MVIEDEHQVQLKKKLADTAIACAMEGKWQDAVNANKEIVEKFPEDVETFNRLGRAYMELGKYSQSREAYGKSLVIDPANTIARKNIRRLAILEEEGVNTEVNNFIEPQQFIEEIGKTGVTELRDLAPINVLARINSGERVHLRVVGSDLHVLDNRNTYVGRVEPVLSKRLIKLINGGNQYSSAIISHSSIKVQIIIREIYRDPSQAGNPSFPAQNIKTPKPWVSHEAFRGDLDYEGLMAEESMENIEESGGIDDD